MSLLKQLLLSVTVAIAFILVGTLVFSIGGARQYLNMQLQAQSENAATSLALSLSQPSNQDPVTRELLIAALYDSGQFRDVRLTASDGRLLVARSVPPVAGAGVAPGWFGEMLPLITPVATRQVSNGWRQVGELSVTSDDLSARDSLWRSSTRVLYWVVGAGLLWALFAILLIRWFKRALRSQITEQVQAIVEGGQPQKVLEGRRVPELAQASRMIREVRERVHATAQEQTAHIESLRLELNQDPVSGLANRKYLLNELRRILQPGTGSTALGGHVMLFRQRDLTALNVAMAHDQADQWLRSVGQALLRVTEAFSHMHLQAGRLNGSDFVILMPESNGVDASRMVQQVRRVLDAKRVRLADGRLCRWSLALTDFTQDCDVSAILSRLDHGLMRAESAGHDEVEYVSYADGGFGKRPRGQGEADWRNLLTDALSQGKLELSLRRLAYENDDVLIRHEASLELRDGDDLLSATLFMPPAVRLGLSADCDLRAIELGLEWLESHSGELVLKISLQSLLLPHFFPEMKRRLSGLHAQPEQIGRLVLEIDAHGLVAYGVDVRRFCFEVNATGARTALRRLSDRLDALMHLHEVAFAYVKLSGDLVAGLRASPGAQRLAIAVADTATGLGVKVYADDAPDVETRSLLRQCGIHSALAVPSATKGANKQGISS